VSFNGALLRQKLFIPVAVAVNVDAVLVKAIKRN